MFGLFGMLGYKWGFAFCENIYIYICICCVDILFTKRYMGDDHVGGSWLIIVMNGNKYTYISL